MSIIKGANLAVRFLLELCALAALAYWGFKTGTGPISKMVLGIGAPLLAAVVWATFVAPGASIQVPGPLRLVLQVVIFGLAIAGLAATGHRTLAWSLGITVVINGALMYVWGQ
jgi:hypothetical protein